MTDNADDTIRWAEGTCGCVCNGRVRPRYWLTVARLEECIWGVELAGR